MKNRSLITISALALLVIGCNAATSPTPEASIAASLAGSASASSSEEPTPTGSPTATPGPTAIGQQDLDLDLTLTYKEGVIEGPGLCQIGPDGIWIYLEHRTGGTLDVYLTVGAAQGGVGGGAITGGGEFGPESVRVRIYDLTAGGFIDTDDAHADLEPDLRSGSFSGTWDGEPLVADYSCS